ncbi:MAG TPA: hypothetical protein VGE79_04060 [Niastella sp.]
MLADAEWVMNNRNIKVVGKLIYLHVFKAPEGNTITLPDAKLKIKGVKILGSNTPVKFTKQKTGVAISTEGVSLDGIDTIIVVEQA